MERFRPLSPYPINSIRYEVVVTRIAPYQGQLTITDAGKEIFSQQVGLMYNAQFGPDMADVAAVSRYGYLPYGVGPMPGTDHYLYTGKERDTESQLDYFGARYYGSSMGRFMSPDPSQLYFADPSNPQSFNLYSYVQNNPLVNVDPNGLDCLYAQDSGSVNIQAGDCTNAGGVDDNGVYVNGTVNSATQDNNGNVVSYSTDSGSFLADGTSTNQSVTVTAQDPGVVGALSLEAPQQIDPIRQLAIGITVDSQHSFGCIAQAYGVGAPGESGRYMGQPVAGTKRFVTAGSSIGSSPISEGLRGLGLKGRFPAPVGGPGTGTGLRFRSSPNLGANVARWVPFLGLAADAYAMYKLNSCLGGGN
jgi:RHS repeat-associated protein